MALADLSSKFQRLAAGLVSTAPSRDALVQERDALLAAPPTPPANTLALPEPQLCLCEHCTARSAEEQARRITWAAWSGRLRTLEQQLFVKTYGGEDERDAVGTQLVRLHADLLKAFDQSRARQWERIIQFDGRGHPTGAHETAAVIGEVNLILVHLRRFATEQAPYLSTAELDTAITDTRQKMVAALAAPVERALDPMLAARAGTQAGEVGEADRHGLTPGITPDVTTGTVRFSRRGRA